MKPKFRASLWTSAFSLLVTLVILRLPAEAAFLRNVPQTLTQPDGQVLNCYASGDEHYHWLHDASGYTIVKDPASGFYVYAAQAGDRLAPTIYVPGRIDPKWAGLKPYAATLNEQVIERERRVSPRMLTRSESASPAPTDGTLNNIVIFIRFSGESEFTDSTSTYDDMFNDSTTGANSMYNYFKETSYNSLNINTTFYPTPGATVLSYQDSHPRGYYQIYNASTNTIGYIDPETDGGADMTNREMTLLKNAVDAVSSEVPSGLDVDADDDGYVDNVCFVVYGSPDGWSDLLWPHMWMLYAKTAYINSKRVWAFNFQLRDSLLYDGNGVLCHEMFHSLGAPDLYHYSYDGLSPVYTWDIMEDNQDPPQHMGAYMKYRYGSWIASIPEITTAGTYTLNPITSSTGNCYKIRSPYSSTEYFVVEYRRKTGTFESSIPGSGLLVYRINTNCDGEGNKDGPPDEVYIYRLNGTRTVNGNPASANFSSDVGRTQIDDGTNPSSFLSNGSSGGLSISGIGSAGSTISFDVSFPGVATPAFSPDGGEYYAARNVTISCSTSGATIHYTTDGDTPTESDPTIASGASVTIDRSLTLKAKAWKTGVSASSVKSAVYTFSTVTPSFSPTEGTYTSTKAVTVSCSTSGATIHYTTNGVDPTESDPTVTSGSTVSVTRSLTLKAKAWKTDWSPSTVRSGTYTLVVPTPSFSPNGGSFSSAQDVIVTCAVADAILHYTTNGTDPTESDPVIASGGTVNVNRNMTLKAKGWKTGWTSGSVRSASFLIDRRPHFDPNGDGKDDIAGLTAAGAIWYTTTKTYWKPIAGTLDSLTVGDFDGDGDDDIAGLNSAGKIYYTTNKSTWTSVPGTLTSLVAGDFDGDGIDELAGLSASGAIWYTTNMSTWISIPGTLSKLAVGDFDGDGDDDLAGLNSAGKIYYTTNKNTWTNIPGALATLVTGDFDGDADDDITGLSAAGTIWYTTNKTTWTSIPGVMSKLTAGDFNDDGTDDLVSLNSLGKIYYTTNKSTWTSVPGTLATLVAGDFDGDGDDDIAGLNSAGDFWYTLNKTTWTNIPGTLAKLYSAR